MKNKIHIILAILFIASNFMDYQPAIASANHQEKSAPKALCMPGIYLNEPGDCLLAGPAAYLTEMAAMGLTFPLAPLAYTPIDPALGSVNVRYAEVRTANAPVFGSIEDAVGYKKKNAVQTLNGQTVYISYTDEQEVSGKKLYMVGPNLWMTGNDLSRIGALPQSQGLTFQQTPATAFGWVLSYFAPAPQIETKRTPGAEQQDYTGRLLNLYDVVQIFSEVQVGNEQWYLIGPDEWVQQKYVAKVTPNPVPPDGVNNQRWIEINLYEQTLAIYDTQQLVFATIIATGSEPFWTRPGLFKIFSKLETTPMTGSFAADHSDAYYLEDVPWAMYFDEARAIHGAYWRAKMGFPQSRGCVNMAVGDARFLFEWAQDGDWVYVWDPSGQTPTDPSLYGSGGF